MSGITPFSLDVEANGPIPGDYSMIGIGIVRIDRKLDCSYGSDIHPLNDNYEQGALDSIGMTHEQTLLGSDPRIVMASCVEWIKRNTYEGTRPVLLSDNNGFDYMFFHWYAIHFLGVGGDPFGHTSRNINDIFKGLSKNFRKNHKHLRKMKHDHNPVNDARGNGEAFIAMVDKYELKGIEIR